MWEVWSYMGEFHHPIKMWHIFTHYQQMCLLCLLLYFAQMHFQMLQQWTTTDAKYRSKFLQIGYDFHVSDNKKRASLPFWVGKKKTSNSRRRESELKCSVSLMLPLTDVLFRFPCCNNCAFYFHLKKKCARSQAVSLSFGFTLNQWE